MWCHIDIYILFINNICKKHWASNCVHACAFAQFIKILQKQLQLIWSATNYGRASCAGVNIAFDWSIGLSMKKIQKPFHGLWLQMGWEEWNVGKQDYLISALDLQYSSHLQVPIIDAVYCYATQRSIRLHYILQHYIAFITSPCITVYNITLNLHKCLSLSTMDPAPLNKDVTLSLSLIWEQACTLCALDVYSYKSAVALHESQSGEA